MKVEKLVKLTYNKIFFDELHILKGNLEEVKSAVLKNKRLLSNKFDELFFITDLAEKIKNEKINECLEQKRKYGEVLMQDFEVIFAIYNWLDTLTSIKKDVVKNTVQFWTKEEPTLEQLSKYLYKNSLILDLNSFCDVNNPNLKHRIDWRGTQTLLIYLFKELKEKGFIDSNISENSFIESNFTQKGKIIANVRNSKFNIKESKKSKPRNHNIIDSFFEKK
jgi:hypothetical protein